VGADAGEIVDQTSGGVERLVLILGEIIHFDVMPQAEMTLRYGFRASQQLDERGFAGANSRRPGATRSPRLITKFTP